MQFEWDEAKNTINIRKHGIDFADVTDMFNHPML
ncbi:MAG: BrnT family toxin, partial [Pseudomonadales bacterium]|nr:BrnT family toxin [Pseudomonadales bacterium]